MDTKSNLFRRKTNIFISTLFCCTSEVFVLTRNVERCPGDAGGRSLFVYKDRTRILLRRARRRVMKVAGQTLKSTYFSEKSIFLFLPFLVALVKCMRSRETWAGGPGRREPGAYSCTRIVPESRCGRLRRARRWVRKLAGSYTKSSRFQRKINIFISNLFSCTLEVFVVTGDVGR